MGCLPGCFGGPPKTLAATLTHHDGSANFEDTNHRRRFSLK